MSHIMHRNASLFACDGISKRWNAFKSSYLTITSVCPTPISQCWKPRRIPYPLRLHVHLYTARSWPIHQPTLLQKLGNKTPRQPGEQVWRTTSSTATGKGFLQHRPWYRLGNLSGGSDLTSGTSTGCALWSWWMFPERHQARINPLEWGLGSEWV